MNNRNTDKCLSLLASVQSLLDLSLVAIDNPNTTLDRKSLADCLLLCCHQLEEIRQNLQTDNAIILPNSQSFSTFEQKNKKE